MAWMGGDLCMPMFSASPEVPAPLDIALVARPGLILLHT